jgi:hypothetical protein
MFIAHEAPLSIMPEVQALSDYDYCLVHLLEESEEYLNFFKNARQKGRTIIMDCSLFELGTAFDSEKYAFWINEIQPDEYIVPDVWLNHEANLESFNNFTSKYKFENFKTKSIGVLQAGSLDEFRESYKFMSKHADKVAISFGYDYYFNSFAEKVIEDYKRLNPDSEITAEIMQTIIRPTSYCVGRISLIEQFIEENLIVNKPHHLLGCGLPVEFSHYKNNYQLFDFIDSLDTSHPIVSGFFEKSYMDENNTFSKIPTKMVEIFDKKVNRNQMLAILNNIKIFRDHTVI